MTKLWDWLADWVASAIREGFRRALSSPVGSVKPPEAKALTGKE